MINKMRYSITILIVVVNVIIRSNVLLQNQLMDENQESNQILKLGKNFLYILHYRVFEYRSDISRSF